MSQRHATEREILESLRHVYTFGLRINHCHARDQLRRGNLIKQMQRGFWLLTTAGRVALENET